MKTHSLSLTPYHKVIATVTLLAITLWSLGFPTWIQSVSAANLTTVSDTLSDSDLGVNSNHTIAFSNPTAIAESDTIVITFPGEFNLSTSTATLGLEDFDVATGTTPTELTLAYDCGTGS